MKSDVGSADRDASQRTLVHCAEIAARLFCRRGIVACRRSPSRSQPAEHHLHHGRRPRQRRSRLPRQRHQDAEHRQARQRGRAARVLLRHAGLHAVPRGADDRPLSDALRPADAGDLPEPHLRPADRRADAAAGAEGRGLSDRSWSASGTSAMPTRSTGRRTAASITSTATSSARWTTSPRSAAASIDWQRNGKFLKEEGYYTTLIGDEAVKLIEQQDAGQAVLPLLRVARAPRALPGDRRPTRTATRPPSRIRRAAPTRR